MIRFLLKSLDKLSDWLLYASFALMLTGALMVVLGFLSVVFSFGLYVNGFGWLAPRGGFVFTIGFFSLVPTFFLNLLAGKIEQ